MAKNQMLPAGMIINKATGRFHPVVFRVAPHPSEPVDELAGKFVRHKSAGHHTVGFDTREAAMAAITAQHGWIWTGVEWEWDGSGVPALIAWFRFPMPQQPASEAIHG